MARRTFLLSAQLLTGALWAGRKIHCPREDVESGKRSASKDPHRVKEAGRNLRISIRVITVRR